MLTLRLELLSGRYVASEFNDRNAAEWPLHPARVFSALVAAHHEAGGSDAGAIALRWLERQPPPGLTFSPASTRDLATHYVPVNDKALSDATTVQNAWAQLLAPDLPPKRRAAAEAKLANAYAKSGAATEKLGKGFLASVEHVLPATRTKQPRTFPSVTPEDPVVSLTWAEDPPAEVLAGLQRLAAQLVRVGHSSSFVAAAFTQLATEPGPVLTLTPDAEGDEVLRWVSPGQLAALEALHAAAPYAEQRVMPYVVARYRATRPPTRTAATRFSSSFIVLRRVEGPRLSLTAGEAVAETVRRALMCHADDPPAALISGHEPDGKPLQADHLAIVPLAHVGDRHASGDLLGIALVPPAGLASADLQPLYTALARWEAAQASASDTPRAVLTMGTLGCWTLERCLDTPPLRNLEERTWTRPSTSWASVTPVLFDRHPGSIHDGRATHRRRAIERAHAILREACERIGLPAPVEIELSPAPFFRGSSNASQFGRRGTRADPRPRIHVRLRFAEPVRGPVLLGAGRYRGLGVFRPLGGHHHG